MIRILCQDGTEAVGQQVRDQLARTYGIAPPNRVAAGETWTAAPEWDDLLIVVFRTVDVAASMRSYIDAFRHAHPTPRPDGSGRQPGGFIIPVATDPANTKPPDPISGVKAAVFDGSPASLDRIARAAGVFLGMALQPRRQRIFISYRSSDGEPIARDLHARLEARGFQPWLDEAPENLAPGDDVQAQIHEHIADVGLLLVVDTPDAPGSLWVTEEIETAIAQLLPIVPVVAGEDISRFIALSSLRRRAPVKPGGIDGEPLADSEWDRVLAEIEQVLLSAYRRRLLIRTKAEQAFRDGGFVWTVLDDPRRMYRAQRNNSPLPATIVLSHCFIQDITYMPALAAYSDYLQQLPEAGSFNHKLCIYDRDKPLSDAEFGVIDSTLQGRRFILAHYNELGILMLTNFAKLR